MKVIVLGDGLLGSEIVKQTGWDYISRKKDGFDIITSSFFNFIPNDCDVIVNCIACTDTYSNDKDLHWNVNYKSIIRLSNFCMHYAIKLVHISTDYVYTNSVCNASENDVPIHGNNWYSYTKLLGDSYVQLNSDSLILRGTHKETPFKYSKSWINQIGNFDYVNEIAKLYIQLINKGATGVYNVGTNLKTMSELAQKTNTNSEPVFITDSRIPINVSMNLNKLNDII